MFYSKITLKNTKSIFSCLFFLAIGTVSAQDKKSDVTPVTTDKPVTVVSAPADVVNPRTAATSVQLESHPTAPLPYNVDDIYMGRAEEFKKLFKTNELPVDFPIYEKQYGWGLREYNAVVGA